MEREDVVAAVVSAAGGELIGRVRLQKSVYLLDRLGLNSPFKFEYHHYGPYSRDLDSATIDAKASKLVSEQHEHRKLDGAMFSVFKLAGKPNELALGSLGRERASRLMKLFASTNVTVLELAATVDWLWKFESCSDWRSEIARRKGAKVQNGRLERAIELLKSLDLRPPEAAV